MKNHRFEGFIEREMSNENADGKKLYQKNKVLIKLKYHLVSHETL